MQAILLAGDLRTRLHNVVNDRPKSMALIEGKPSMEYVTHGLAHHGVTDIVLAVGYERIIMEEHFNDGTTFRFHADYAYEEMPLGTVGVVENVGRLTTEGRFYALNRGTFYQIDYTRFLEQQDNQNPDMALVLRSVPDISRYGQTILDRDGLLIGFSEKTEDAEEGTINGGIYLTKQRLLDEIPEGKVLLENDMIPRWLSERRYLGGFVNGGYFIDVGIPEAYFQLQEDVKNKMVI